MNCLSDHITSGIHNISMTGHCWRKPWSPSPGSVWQVPLLWSYWNLLLYPHAPWMFSYSSLWNKVTAYIPCQQSVCIRVFGRWDLAPLSNPLKEGCHHKWLGVLLYGRFISSLFIYSFMYLYRYGFIDVHFILRAAIQFIINVITNKCYLLCCSNCFSFAHW